MVVKTHDITEFMHDISNYLQVLGLRIELADVEYENLNLYAHFERISYFMQTYQYTHNMIDLQPQEAINRMQVAAQHPLNITLRSINTDVFRMQCMVLFKIAQIMSITCEIDDRQILIDTDNPKVAERIMQIMQDKFSDILCDYKNNKVCMEFVVQDTLCANQESIDL